MKSISDVASSADGVPIHYDVHGEGEVALVFVHGWGCDRRVWRNQVGYFTPRYRVVALDLAGHGDSGSDRPTFSIAAFAADVEAVAERLGANRIVLIGHSMSGGVVIEAARHLAGSVTGVVGVDCLWDIDQDRTPEQVAAFLGPFRADFAAAAQGFMKSMFTPNADPATVAEIVAAGSSMARSQVGVEALEASMSNGPNVRAGLEEIGVPVALINSTHWRATNLEAAARRGIYVATMSGAGHFVMLDDPAAFNRLLDDAVRKALQPAAPL